MSHSLDQATQISRNSPSLYIYEHVLSVSLKLQQKSFLFKSPTTSAQCYVKLDDYLSCQTVCSISVSLEKGKG